MLRQEELEEKRRQEDEERRRRADEARAEMMRANAYQMKLKVGKGRVWGVEAGGCWRRGATAGWAAWVRGGDREGLDRIWWVGLC